MDINNEIARCTECEACLEACPFCIFNLNYTSTRKELGKKTVYLTSLALESLE